LVDCLRLVGNRFHKRRRPDSNDKLNGHFSSPGFDNSSDSFGNVYAYQRLDASSDLYCRQQLSGFVWRRAGRCIPGFGECCLPRKTSDATCSLRRGNSLEHTGKLPVVTTGQALSFTIRGLEVVQRKISEPSGCAISAIECTNLHRWRPAYPQLGIAACFNGCSQRVNCVAFTFTSPQANSSVPNSGRC
jgi:hypothetical protein